VSTPPDPTVARYVQVTTITRRVVEQVQALWHGMRPEAVLAEMEGATGRRILNLVILGQLSVAQGAQAFVSAAMSSLNAAPQALLGSVAATTFAGTAADGRRLDTLLFLPAITVASRRAAGASDEEALLAGLTQMATITSTTIADVNRQATQTAMAANPAVKYYTRVVNLPACARCIILAGRTYAYSEGFRRHENCDCELKPLDRADWEAVRTPKQIYESMTPEQRRQVFGEAGSQAIDQGADMNQIVNARRGMSDAGEATTTEGTTVRGEYGRQLRRAGGAVDRGAGRYSTVTTERLSPHEIFRRTSERDEQVALLRQYAYLT
jgi:hypothetical protein